MRKADVIEFTKTALPEPQKVSDRGVSVAKTGSFPSGFVGKPTSTVGATGDNVADNTPPSTEFLSRATSKVGATGDNVSKRG